MCPYRPLADRSTKDQDVSSGSGKKEPEVSLAARPGRAGSEVITQPSFSVGHSRVERRPDALSRRHASNGDRVDADEALRDYERLTGASSS